MSLSYLGRRVLIAMFSLWAAITILFAMIHLVPGDPVSAILGDAYTERAATALRAQLALDRPLPVQYVTYLGSILTGDLGTSYISRQPVMGEVLGNFGFTLRLALAGLAVSVLLGIPLGFIAALRRGRLADIAAMTVAVLGVSMPGFWLGILLMVIFAVQLGWFPLIGIGNEGDVVDIGRHLVLPAVTLGMRGAGLIARVTRSALLETLNQDYVRTARAKGVHDRTVVVAHALRNAMLPIVTVAGLDLGRMLGGTTVIETVFSRPGTGVLLIQAVLTRDYPMIQAAFLLFLTVIIVINLLVDVLYARLDPRVVYA
ncbi:MAG TPA: ABC transporter permease [Trueperaceae bacterium]